MRIQLRPWQSLEVVVLRDDLLVINYKSNELYYHMHCYFSKRQLKTANSLRVNHSFLSNGDGLKWNGNVTPLLNCNFA